MLQKSSRLDWWQLKLLLPLMIGLIVLNEKYLAFSPLGQQLMLIVIVLAIYGLLAYWLYVHQTAMSDELKQADAWQSTATIEDIGQDEPITASDATFIKATISTASIEMPTKNGASMRTWLN